MAETKDGGPAFPNRWANDGENEGMSLRDWFAGQALAGMIESHGMGAHRHEYAARDAYSFADAMLAARKEGQGGGA